MSEDTRGSAADLPPDHPLARIAESVQWLSKQQTAELQRVLPDPEVVYGIVRAVEASRSRLAQAADTATRLELQRQRAILLEHARVLEHVRAEVTRTAEALGRLVSGWGEVDKRRALNALATEASQVLAAQQAFANFSTMLAEQQQAAVAFRPCGWPIAPSMPDWLIRRVVDLYRQGRSRYASQAIIGYYRRDDCHALTECLDRWRKHPLLGPRIKILEDAVAAHRDRTYTLSVPALAPQVEGVASDYVSRNGLPAKLGRCLQVCKAAIGDPEDRPLGEWAVADTLLYQLATSQYTYVDFRVQIGLAKRRRAVTRHTVAHGVAAAYNQEGHSLRLLLLLDALSALI